MLSPMGSTALASILQHLQLLLHLATWLPSAVWAPGPGQGLLVLCVLLFLCSTKHTQMSARDTLMLPPQIEIRAQGGCLLPELRVGGRTQILLSGSLGASSGTGSWSFSCCSWVKPNWALPVAIWSLPPYPQPPPVKIRRREKTASHLVCLVLVWSRDFFLISEGSVWNSEKSFILESQALANQKIFGFTLRYLMTV